MKRTAAIILLLVVGCTSSPPRSSVVLAETEAVRFRGMCSRPGVPEFQATWTPTPADVTLMESRFRRLRRTKSHECCIAGFRVGRLEKFDLQYVGVIIGSRRFIYINAACSEVRDAQWSNRAYTSVCDGGWCYWGALYDVENGRFNHVASNGIG